MAPSTSTKVLLTVGLISRLRLWCSTIRIHFGFRQAVFYRRSGLHPIVFFPFYFYALETTWRERPWVSFSSFRFSPVHPAMDSLWAIMQSTRVTASAPVAVQIYETSFESAYAHAGVFLAFEPLIPPTLDALPRNAFSYCTLVEPSSHLTINVVRNLLTTPGMPNMSQPILVTRDSLFTDRSTCLGILGTPLAL